jgi:uncharacterized SAM-binding protein YcdF (DUF218 family)
MISRHVILKNFLFFFALLGGLLIIELGYFFWMFTRPVTIPPNLETDAIVVFNGSPNRVKAGYEIAQSLNTRYLIISPALKGQLTIYDGRYKLPATVSHINEPYARTTLENAVLTRKIIDDHNLTSILLVTSAYHMPRSRACLKLCLLGAETDVRVYCAPTGRESSLIGYMKTSKGVKTLYNEMVRFWGSMVEWIAFKIRGKLPEKNPKDIPLVKFLKSAILFDV